MSVPGMTDNDDWLGDVDIAKDAPIPGEQIMSKLGRAVQDLRLYEETVSELEGRLSLAKESVRTVSERDIPNLFDEAGISSFTTMEGRKVSVKKFVSGKILRPEAYDWFEENNLEDIVKVNVSIALRRTDIDKINHVLEILNAEGVEAEVKESIHHSTLSAVLMDLSSRAQEVPPPDLVDIYIGRKTVVK